MCSHSHELTLLSEIPGPNAAGIYPSEFLSDGTIVGAGVWYRTRARLGASYQQRDLSGKAAGSIICCVVKDGVRCGSTLGNKVSAKVHSSSYHSDVDAGENGGDPKPYDKLSKLWTEGFKKEIDADGITWHVCEAPHKRTAGEVCGEKVLAVSVEQVATTRYTTLLLSSILF